MGNSCTTTEDTLDNLDHNLNYVNEFDELAENFIQTYCFMDNLSTTHSMVLLQHFQKYVESKVNKETYNNWINTTNPIDRLQCLITNLERYYNIKWFTFDTIIGIKLRID